MVIRHTLCALESKSSMQVQIFFVFHFKYMNSLSRIIHLTHGILFRFFHFYHIHLKIQRINHKPLRMTF
jgi:hypothetical protein